MSPMTTAPESIESQNPVITARPNTFSQNRRAIDALTILFDITAISIVEDAITSESHHTIESVAMV